MSCCGARDVAREARNLEAHAASFSRAARGLFFENSRVRSDWRGCVGACRSAVGRISNPSVTEGRSPDLPIYTVTFRAL
jgi:hypothetical protein